MAKRLQGTGMPKYAKGFEPTLHEKTLEEPLRWKKSHTIFVCSMADLFHEAVPFGFIDKVMGTINKTKRHCYQILTKRPERMLDYFSKSAVPSNAWLGVTVEDQKGKTRIDVLRKIQPTVRFLSCEPLLEDLGRLDLTGIDWVIVGGESGIKARLMRPGWVRSIMGQARGQGAAFFFKQWGTWGPDGIRRSKKGNGNHFEGKAIQMIPERFYEGGE
jgi:protein gp37